MGERDPEYHHCRILGGKRERSEILPLCPGHHRLGYIEHAWTGKLEKVLSIHGAKKSFRARYGDESELLVIRDQLAAKILENTIGGKP